MSVSSEIQPRGRFEGRVGATTTGHKFNFVPARTERYNIASLSLSPLLCHLDLTLSFLVYFQLLAREKIEVAPRIADGDTVC